MDYSLNEQIFDRIFQWAISGRFLLYSAIFLLALKILISVSGVSFPQNIFFADISKTAIINLTNQARQSAGLAPLAENQKLDDAALLKAQDMAQKEYFSHESPDGLTPWHWFLKTGYNYKYAGENLAIGFFESEDVYNAWLDSPSHRENILNANYKETGMAILSGFGQNNAVVVVQLFGTQKIAQQAQPVKTSINVQKPADAPAEQNTPAPVQAENEQPQAPEVLSQADSAKDIRYPIPADLSDYEGVLQAVIYIFFAIAIMAFYIVLPDVVGGGQKSLIRLIMVIAILSLAAFLNREIIFYFLPRQVII